MVPQNKKTSKASHRVEELVELYFKQNSFNIKYISLWRSWLNFILNKTAFIKLFKGCGSIK